MKDLASVVTCLSVLALSGCGKPTLHPTQGEIVEAVYGLGTVETEQIYLARFGIQVAVHEFYVKEGQDVVVDQKLFRTDQGVVFRSPIAGRVTDISFHLKENIPPQATLLTVTNLDKLYLSVALEQQAAMRLRKGMKTEISFEFFRNTKILGTIESFYPKNSEFIAKVSLDEPPAGILPGMTADVAIEVDRKKEALLVPTKAIANGHIVLLREGKKQRLPVKLGLVDLERAELLEPVLTTKDEIVMP
jgi:membrane fusion protein, macrolide-specific efflux system